MKLTCILIIASCLQIQARSHGQGITISMKNVSLEKAFAAIKKQTGYSIFYNSRFLEKTDKVSIEVKNATIQEVLTICLRNEPLDFEIDGQSILISHAAGLKRIVQILTVLAPPIEVKGRVVDKQGNGISNVSIGVSGTTTGVTSDVNGYFTIIVPDERSILIFSYVGFQTQKLAVGNQKSLLVQLENSNAKMDQVTVVGYGSQRRRQITGAASKVGGEEYKNAITTTIEQALQGRATGVQVTETSGEPGADIVVRIRGINSISSNNQPLYVIDGFPVPAYTEASAPNLTGAYSSNGLYGLNPNDIENLEVLKDASATAIYGSRGANGVILITTKKGKAGMSLIELINKTSVSILSNPYKMMSSREYASLKNEINVDAGMPPLFNLDSISALPNTDWLSEISQNGIRQETGVNYRGGSGNTNYFLSGTYLFDNGVVKWSDNKRGSLRFNLNSNIKSWYDVRVQLSATSAKLTRAITESKSWGGGSQSGAVMNALRSSPLHTSEYNINGAINSVVAGVQLGTNVWTNPSQELSNKIDLTYNDQIQANIENVFYLNKAKNFEFHALMGASLENSQRNIMLPPWLGNARNYNGISNQAAAKTRSYNSNFYFSHNLVRKDHNLSTTLGIEYNDIQLSTNHLAGTNFNFPSIIIDNLVSAKNQSISSYKEEAVIQSGFLRENYSFKNKYVLSFSFRADGSSKFASNHKWAYFPSLGAAWNIDQENFMQNMKSVDFAKLRVSYGLTGSQSLPSYRSQRNYALSAYELGSVPGGGNFTNALFVQQPSNPDLKWETTSQFNVGLDAALFSEKINITADYYNKLTEDILQNLPVPSQAGYDLLWANNGSIRNKGFELSVGVVPVSHSNFGWSSRINYSRNKTIVVDLGKFDPKTQGATSLGGNILGGGTQTIIIPGKELGLFYGYKAIGLYQSADFDQNGNLIVPLPPGTNDNYLGRVKLEDVNGSGAINDSDRVVIGHAQPKFVMGWDNNIRFKNWNLNLFFYGSIGNDILNMTNRFIGGGIINLEGFEFNQTQDWYDKRWTKTNQHNDPRYPAAHPKNVNAERAYPFAWDPTSAAIEDGSFLRLKTTTISYTPKLRTKIISNFSVYATATNLFTITKYTGFDPEVSSYGTNVRTIGIDYGAYPRQRTYTLGFRASL